MLKNGRAALILIMVGSLLTASGCVGSTEPVGPTSVVSTPVPSTPAPRPGSSAEATCGVTAPDGVTVEDLTIETADGVTLNAAVTGGGEQGVVLLHQTDNGLCGWLRYATRLAGDGFHVLAFDFRCTFGSTCIKASGEDGPNVIGDVTAAVKALKERGATEVALVGASYGGAVAIGACTKVEVSRCAALSAALFDNPLGDGSTANQAIGRLRRPLLFAVAPDDPDSPIADGRALVRRAPKRVVTLVELPAGAGHGWDTVADPTDPTQPSAFAGELGAFLRG